MKNSLPYASLFCVAALAVVLAPFTAFAQSTWDAGGVDTAWSTTNNWVGDTLPLTTDTVTLATSGSAANLNGARTVDALILNRSTAGFRISDSTNSASGLTITSGNLTFGNANNMIIDSNVTLGASGTWNSDGGAGTGLTVNGSIQGNYGITLDTGSSVATQKSLTLSGSNTFTGGVTISNWDNANILYLNNKNALGTGNLNVNGGPTSGNGGVVYFGTGDTGQMAVFNNSINFGATNGGSVITMSAAYGTSAGVQIKSLIGTSNSTVAFTAGGRTWRFDEGISITGGTVSFGNNFAVGVGTFEVGGAGGARKIQMRNNTGNGTNLLFTASGTQSGGVQFWDNVGSGGTTLGITQAGNTTFSGLQDLYAAPSGVNYVALDPASRLTVSGNIDDREPGTVNLRINDDFVVNVAGTHTTSGTNAPTGTVQFSRAAGNTYDGTTTVYAGTLLISNTAGSATGTGSVTVRGGATLAGTGIIASGGSNGLTVLSTGIIAPGDGGIGDLTINGAGTNGVAATFSSGAVFSFDLNAATEESDRLVLTNGAAGDFAFNGNVIDFNILTGTLAEGQTYTLFSGTNVDQFVGLTWDGDGYITSGLSIGTGLTGPYATYSQLQIFNNEIILVASVPEPGTAALLGMVGCVVLFFRPRRRLG